ncbi:MAG: hypothetical protein SH868_16005 [Bythopirellula sp.]|nr:hypothetical protein [Bythopirellula sp.]
MHTRLTELTYNVHLQPGEHFAIPEEAAEILGPGDWTVSIRPATDLSPRNHAAFLNSYVPEDEGLYDDYSAR